MLIALVTTRAQLEVQRARERAGVVFLLPALPSNVNYVVMKCNDEDSCYVHLTIKLFNNADGHNIFTWYINLKFPHWNDQAIYAWATVCLSQFTIHALSTLGGPQWQSSLVNVVAIKCPRCT